jgi:hypothetical protein
MSWEIEVYAPGPPPPPPTPVVLNANGGNTRATSTTSVNLNGLTIVAGTHIALVAQIAISVAATGLSLVWDAAGANQSLTQIGTIGDGIANYQLWGLVAPVTGNKLLTASWTNNATIIIGASAYNNVSQIGGSSSFGNFTTNQGTGTTTSLTVTVPISALAIDFSGNAGSQNMSAPTQTQLFIDNTFNIDVGASYGTSGVFGWTVGASTSWTDIGCAILAG